jgi:hypothetical protein
MNDIISLMTLFDGMDRLAIAYWLLTRDNSFNKASLEGFTSR